LIEAAELRRLHERVALLDVRWDLSRGSLREEYEQGHIPDSVFVDLDTELADPPGAGGRHPLPAPERFQAAMRRAGVRGDQPVVVLDGGNGAAAARAWWLLRYFSHPDVAVLDGGLPAWIADAGRLEAGPSPVLDGDFIARAGAMPLLDADGARKTAEHGILLDARAPQRFRGEHEPMDPVAGRIPGAVNRPAPDNVDARGRFLGTDELRAAFERLGVTDDVALGAYCGSGVTAAHEVLALELAGYRAALYAGSWSEWITDPTRPVQRGPR
jgi:thiosulfate/3-mercaptopyruvate sulfurtransferase